MSYFKGVIDLSEIKRGALIELKKKNNIFHRQLVSKFKCNKLIVTNILKRVEETKKKNLNLLALETY